MRSLPNCHTPRVRVRAWNPEDAPMNPAIIMLRMGRQSHFHAPRINAHAPGGMNGPKATEAQPADPANFLVGSSELWNSGEPTFPFTAR